MELNCVYFQVRGYYSTKNGTGGIGPKAFRWTYVEYEYITRKKNSKIYFSFSYFHLGTVDLL